MTFLIRPGTLVTSLYMNNAKSWDTCASMYWRERGIMWAVVNQFGSTGMMSIA